jgi:hypothetical protein
MIKAMRLNVCVGSPVGASLVVTGVAGVVAGVVAAGVAAAGVVVAGVVAATTGLMAIV